MKRLLLSILAVILLVEEWLWDVFTDLDRCLTPWLHLERLERWLAQAHPWVAMAVFLAPIALAVPVELAALALSADGQIVAGMALLIADKLFSTLVVTWIFAATREQLMSFAWFAVVYNTITSWLRWAHERLRETAAYRQGLKLKLAAHDKLMEWLRNLPELNPSDSQ